MQDDLERLEPSDTSTVRGTFSSRALRVLRLVGFYSSPAVVELLYSGMLADNIPEGRSSATKYISQTYLTNVRCRGMMSSYLKNYTDGGIDRFMKLAYTLAVEESEEAQFAITSNMERWSQQAVSKIDVLDTIDVPFESSSVLPVSETL